MERIHQRAALRMLRTEGAALRNVREALKRVIAAAASQAPNDPTAAMLAMHSASKHIAAALLAAIAAARHAARDAAQQQVDEEAEAVADATGTTLSTSIVDPSDPVDAIRSESAAVSVASGWLALALAAVSIWSRRERDTSLPRALIRTTVQVDARIRRIVTTEVAQAHSDEHRKRWSIIRRNNPPPAGRVDWSERVFRRWDARLDRKVCATCRLHDSEEAAFDRSFRLGHEPGDVHPNCRCLSTVIVLPADGSTPLGVNAKSPAPYVESARTAA